jgi:hypothetical protein
MFGRTWFAASVDMSTFSVIFAIAGRSAQSTIANRICGDAVMLIHGGYFDTPSVRRFVDERP